LFESLGLKLPGEARNIQEELEWELDELEARNDAYKEYIDILREEEPRNKRIAELEGENEELDTRVEEQQSKLEGLRKQIKEEKVETGRVPPELEDRVEELERSVNNLSRGLENFAGKIGDALNTIITMAERGKEPEERETLPPPPDWFENVARRYPSEFEVRKGWLWTLTFLPMSSTRSTRPLRPCP